MILYLVIAAILLVAELAYFKIADKCNIIDKPNERSSHTNIVLRGGGIIFAISMVVWSLTPFPSPMGEGSTTLGIVEYWPFIIGLVLIAGVSFWDDVKSLPDSLRMAVQIISILLMFWSMGLYTAADSWLWTAVIVVVALFFCVGATNFINFMDGINGITAAYSLAMLIPLIIENGKLKMV